MTAHSISIFEAEQNNSKLLSLIDHDKIPKHIAIIMDGNRRWAKRKNLPPMMGHWEGAEVLTEIVKTASNLGIKTLTVYSFSTENWGRENEEIEALMNIFELYLTRKKESMIKEGIRLHVIGDLSRLPTKVCEALNDTIQATQRGTQINLVLALNYGGRDEIRRAVVNILKENHEKNLDLSVVTEEYISKYLDTKDFEDPELLIRTSGELRLSNFLLWQLSYAEIYTTEVLWPEFSAQDLYEAVINFQQRSRRFGGGNE